VTIGNSALNLTDFIVQEDVATKTINITFGDEFICGSRLFSLSKGSVKIVQCQSSNLVEGNIQFKLETTSLTRCGSLVDYIIINKDSAGIFTNTINYTLYELAVNATLLPTNLFYEKYQYPMIFQNEIKGEVKKLISLNDNSTGTVTTGTVTTGTVTTGTVTTGTTSIVDVQPSQILLSEIGIDANFDQDAYSFSKVNFSIYNCPENCLFCLPAEPFDGQCSKCVEVEFNVNN